MFEKMGGMLKQAQEMQAKMAEVQKDLASRRIEVSTGGGMVKVVANGIHEVLSIEIDDELINLQDRTVLEDLVTAAMNEVHRKVKELAQSEMSRLTGGIKIPGLFS